jgi:hypothetical protein
MITYIKDYCVQLLLKLLDNLLKNYEFGFSPIMIILNLLIFLNL